MIKIAVDLDGADLPAKDLLQGAIDAVKEKDDLFLLVSSHDASLKDMLDKADYDKERLTFLPSGEPVTNEDDPVSVIRKKRDSSLVSLLKQCKEDKEFKGFVTCGATGCIMMAAVLTLGRVNGLRPALATLLPKSTGGFLILCDCGANSDCRPEQLVQFAYMANAYYKGYFHVDAPRVALLSNGAEAKKGNELVKETHALLSQAQGLNFVGNVEGSTLLNDTCDVLVTDGFSGNIVLKNVEGTAKAIIKNLYVKAKTCTDENQKKTMLNMVNDLIQTYDFNSLGGAVLLAVPVVLVKGHGAGNASTIHSIILQAYTAAKSSFLDDMKQVVLDK